MLLLLVRLPAGITTDCVPLPFTKVTLPTEPLALEGVIVNIPVIFAIPVRFIFTLVPDPLQITVLVAPVITP